MNSKDFITTFYIEGVKTMLDNNLDYLAFQTMGQCINYMGSFVFDRGYGSVFSQAIKTFFPSKYHNLDLEALSTICDILPDKQLELSERGGCIKGDHLDMITLKRDGSYRLLLISDDLYEDFVNAAHKFFELCSNDDVLSTEE